MSPIAEHAGHTGTNNSPPAMAEERLNSKIAHEIIVYTPVRLQTMQQ
jgi:hypothetical protein